MAKNKKNRFLNFFKEVKGELKKVTWPSFKQVRNNTLIVIISVLIIGAFIWIFDALFGFGWEKVLGLRNPDVQVEQTTNEQTSGDTQPADGSQQTETNTEGTQQ